MARMKITFWGVRGSVPSPGPDTVRYGGNTPCVSVEIDDLLLIFDAGTGIRPLGQTLADWPGQIGIFLSHLHWDHVQGLPFFAPLHVAGRPLSLFVPRRRGRTLESIAGMDGIHFPLTSQEVTSRLVITNGDPDALVAGREIRLERFRVNHPGGSDGFRLDHAGKCFVFVPDNEIEPPYPRSTSREALVHACRGADLLVHDAQFLPPDLPTKRGWGHSEVSQTCELARNADVKRLFLFHHDPARTDDELDAIQADACRWLRDRHATVECRAAAEGTVWEL